ncbi:MAG: glucose 1-dehydrogenase [Thermoplasmatales archaeon]
MQAGKLHNLTSLVTGGSRGIGRAIVEEFSREGANVALNYNSSKELAERIKEEFEGVEIFKGDVSNRMDVKRMIDEIYNTFGGLDIVVNNAGIMSTTPFEQFDEPSFERMLEVNVKGPIYVSLESLNYLKRSKHPVIINIASNAGIGTALEGTTFYAITKAAIISLTKRLAFDLRSYKIRVNAIAPGWVETDMTTAGLDNEKLTTIRESFKSRTTVGSYGKPTDIAKVALFLASDDSRYINGQVIVVDGGRIDNLSHGI